MARIYIETLSKEVSENLKNRAYSPEQVAHIHNHVKTRHLNKQTGFLRAAIILTAVSILIFAMTIIGGSHIPVKIVTWIGLIMFGSMAAILLLAKLITNKMMYQFLRALKIGYPELEETFGKESFRK